MPEFHFFKNFLLNHHATGTWPYIQALAIQIFRFFTSVEMDKLALIVTLKGIVVFIHLHLLTDIICTVMQSNRKCFFRKRFHPIVCWVSSDHRNYEITSKSALCREINILPLGAASKNQWWKVFILRKPGLIVHKFSAKKLILYVLEKIFPSLIY